MKKLITILLALCLSMAYLVMPTTADELEIDTPMLSEKSDEELLEFLEEYGVAIPDSLSNNAPNPIDIVRSWIARAEKYPDSSAYGTDNSTYANSVVAAVNQYYGITVAQGYALEAEEDKLILSDFAYIPTNMWGHNCYAFGLGVTDKKYHPGYTDSSISSPQNVNGVSVSTLAARVATDLRSRGNACVTTTTVAPTRSSLNSTQTAICIRKGYPINGGSEDYHVMRLVGNVWNHKPGSLAVLTFRGQMASYQIWTNEGFDGTVYWSATVEYTGTIYYLIYQKNHTYTQQYTGENYHSGSTHYYQYADYCTECGSVTNYTWSSVSCSGPPCPIIAPYALEESK